MKKILSVVTLLGTLAGAASAAPYVMPSPAGGALTPYDWQPVYTVEALYTLGAHTTDPDMWGIRGSLNLYSNAQSSVRHQFNLNIAYMNGNTDFNVLGHEAKVDGTLIPITLGYDLNLGITDDVFFYMGGKVGYALGDIDVKLDGAKLGSLGDGGFTYSVGGGIKVQCSDTIYVKVGYEYGRTFLDAKGGGSDILSGHTISVGVGWKF